MAKHALLTYWLFAVAVVTSVSLLIVSYGSGWTEESKQTSSIPQHTSYTNIFDTVDLNLTRSRPGSFEKWNSSLQKTELAKRALDEEEWQILTCAGEHLININDKLSGDDAREYCEKHVPTWAVKTSTHWANPQDQRQYGWSTLDEPDTIKNLHLTKMRTMLEHYRLSTAPADWHMRTARHWRAWKDVADVERPPTNGFFSYLVNKNHKRSTMIWTAMFSPDFMIRRGNLNTVQPDLRFASDLYYLQYYRWWAKDRSWEGANPDGGSTIPPPKTIVIRSIHEDTIREYFAEIKRRQGDHSSRTGGRKWPGDKFDRDDDEMYVLMASPFGQAVTWFLTQHKHIFGPKSVGRIRVWSTTDAQDDWNMLFEIIDPPDPESSGDEAAGPDPPAEEKHAVAVRQPTTLSKVASSSASLQAIAETRPLRRHNQSIRRARPKKRRRVVAVVDDDTWNSWLCFGRGMYELMTAYDDAAAETVASNNGVLANWKGKTGTQFHDPRDLAQFGWKMLNEPLSDLEEVNIDDSVADSGLPVDDLDDWFHLRTEHTVPWRSEDVATTDRGHDPTKAVFEGYYSAGEHGSEPAVVLGLTVSPWWMVTMRNIRTEIPALQKLSDVVFLTYYEFWCKLMKRLEMSPSGNSKLPSPKYIFIKDIQEEEARDVVFPEIGRRGGFEMEKDEDDDDTDAETTYFGNWPGKTFTPEQDEFYALLYTKQGRGIAAFLFNHKTEFGSKRVKSITIWHSESELSFCLRMEVEDSPQHEAEGSAGRKHRHDSLDLEDVSFHLGRGGSR